MLKNRWIYPRAKQAVVTIDWTEGSDISWVFFDWKVQPEILPITSGYRLTIIYEVDFMVYPKRPETNIEKLGIDVSTSPIYRTLREEMLENPGFYPEGCRIAIPLKHEYPVSEDWASNFRSSLKGEKSSIFNAPS